MVMMMMMMMTFARRRQRRRREKPPPRQKTPLPPPSLKLHREPLPPMWPVGAAFGARSASQRTQEGEGKGGA
jgi:hypothetical protein